MTHHPCWDEFRWCSYPWDTYASVMNPKKPTGSPSWTWIELFLIYHPCPIWDEQMPVHISPGKATDGNPRHLYVSLGKVSSPKRSLKNGGKARFTLCVLSTHTHCLKQSPFQRSHFYKLNLCKWLWNLSCLDIDKFYSYRWNLNALSEPVLCDLVHNVSLNTFKSLSFLGGYCLFVCLEFVCFFALVG